MSYIENMCFVNWRFRSFVQYMIKQHANQFAHRQPHTVHTSIRDVIEILKLRHHVASQ